ncbi:unnamed protein product [Pleuronectes platessa]|uniref:Uncharacterized protein n=1 Tax=Pleuronectes platessa TaxID=8262 RepID=A0A9N7V032_PLEPL|nr:unnamed protein product [Pleuronectes platessa]
MLPLRQLKLPLLPLRGCARELGQPGFGPPDSGTDTRPESIPPTAIPGPPQPVPAFRTGDGHRPAAQEKESPRTSDTVRRRGRGPPPPKKRRGVPPAVWRGGRRGDCSPSRGTCPAV